ncbi:MAG: undecaprenyl-diphosphate phosphatase [Xanthobacteraceae bacterium]
MELLTATLLALLQGVTELFPVSSLGHAVLVPAILHWNVDLRSPDFLPFLVAIHFGTAVALLLYFWRDWIGFARAVISFRDPVAKVERRVFFLVCAATIPAIVVGAVLEKLVREAFALPLVAAAFLIVNGVVLLLAERLKSRGTRPLESLSLKGAVGIGLAQCLAFIPGMSRSGVTLAAGLAAGHDHEAAARFSFLLGTPIILGATVHEAPKFLHSGAAWQMPTLVACLVAGVTAYASIAFLMHYFRKHDFDALDPFAYYCFAAGALALGLLLI